MQSPADANPPDSTEPENSSAASTSTGDPPSIGHRAPIGDPAGESLRWIAAARSDELAEDAGIERTVEGQLVAIFRHGGRLFALEALCAHHGGPLAEGHLAGGCVTCPWHGWQYHLSDGTQTTSGAQLIQTYPVREHDGQIEVAMPSG